jgi:hypothetical protein
MVLQRLYVPLMEFYNAATEVYNHNTVQNATLFGTGASVYAGFRMLDQWNNKYYR